MKTPGRESSMMRIIVLLGLFATAFLFRVVTWQEVLGAEQVFLHGNDAYYHLRRIAWTIANFPAVLTFDPYINFPDGAAPIWTPVFDWLMAATALPAAREGVLSGNFRPLELVAVWFPPLLGSATVVVLYEILRKTFGSSEALIAGLVLCVLPGHVWYSQIGFVDHHVAVALMATVLLGCGMWALAERSLRAALASGAAAALALAIWPGMLLQVAFFEGALLCDCLWPRDRREAVARMRRFAVMNALACALVLPLCLVDRHPQWSRFSPVVLSAFQPWLFVILASLGLACSTLFLRRFFDGRPRRVSLTAALSVVLLAASVAAVPNLSGGVADVSDWLLRSDPFQAQVKESAPLIDVDGGRHAFDFAAGSLSLFLFAMPIVLVLFVGWARRQKDPARFLFAAGFAITMCAAATLQRRFVNSASVPIALFFGWSAVRAQAWLAGSGGTGRRGVTALLVGAVSLAALAPVFASYRPYLESLPGLANRRAAPLGLPEQRRRIGLETGRWLRNNTPEPAEWLGGSAALPYGVLTPWYLGHPIGYASHRPMVTDNFGNDIGERNFDLAQRYFTLDEERALQVLDDLRVRYVVVAWPAGGADPALPRDAMLAALYQRNGNPLVGDDARDVVPALRRHRLIHESRPLDRSNPKNPPYLKVFEVVTGASISGRASPGATVTASLELSLDRGRTFEYRNRSVAGADGRYRIVVPYANQDPPPGLRATGSYRIACGSDSGSLDVHERDVRDGTQLRGPDLCLPETAARR